MSDRPRQELARNQILRSLSRADWDLLKPELIYVDLPPRKRLEPANRRIDDVFFIDDGFASVVGKGPGGFNIEVGMIGREGVTGLAAILGSDRSPHDTVVQRAGAGYRMAATTLREAMARSPALNNLILNYGYAFMIQVAQTAIATARCTIVQCLARWLCMAQDRSDGNEFKLTHETLSFVLGVRRPGITLALDLLEQAGCVETGRGAIRIVDRVRLQKQTNGSYGVPEAELHRLFG